MKVDYHPQAEILAGFVHAPWADDYAAVSLHLSVCLSCRRQVEALRNVIICLHNNEYEQDRHLTEGVISQYINNKLVDNKRSHVMLHLKECSLCMKNVLKARTRRINEEKKDISTPELSELSSVNANNKKSSSIFDANRKVKPKATPIYRGYVPAVAALPLSFAAGIFLSVMVLLVWRSEHAASPLLVSYQDDPTVVFSSENSLEGMGFFSSLNKKIKPFNGMNIILEEENIKLMWQPVEQATAYRLQIYRIDKNGKNIVIDVNTTSTETVVVKPELAEQRYEWLLSGKTDKGLIFKTTGGFVIKNVIDKS